MNIKTKLSYARKLAVLTVALFFAQSVFPAISWALTGGPSSSPMGTSVSAGGDMVDLFTGDFKYNIPVLQLPGPDGGYTFDLAYNSGIRLEDEASWVGLGWSLTPGSLTRSMRGLPDDFNGDLGDEIITTDDIDPNWTVGVTTYGNFEIFGLDIDKIKPRAGVGVRYNSYNGFALNTQIGVTFDVATKGHFNSKINLQLSNDSEYGTTLSPGLSLNYISDKVSSGTTLGMGYNSKRGLQSGALGSSSINRDKLIKNDGDPDKMGGALSAFGIGMAPAATSFMPSYGPQTTGTNLSLTFKLGPDFFANNGNVSVGGFYSVQKYKNANKPVNRKAYGYLNSHYLDFEDRDGLMDFNRENDGAIGKSSSHLPIPVATYDLYYVNGQSLGSTFRPYRTQIGKYQDPEIISKAGGGGFGAELGAGSLFKGGGDASINTSMNYSGGWTGESGSYDFNLDNGNLADSDEEFWYFKPFGEHTTEALDYNEYIGGYDAVEVYDNKLKNNQGTQFSSGVVSRPVSGEDGPRKPRNQVIMSYTNDELMSYDGSEALIKEFDINIYTSVDQSGLIEFSQERHTRQGYDIGHHIGGFTVLKENSVRYNYGLPVYNTYTREETFSANTENSTYTRSSEYPIPQQTNYHKFNGGDGFLKRNEISPYASAYQLTSILGNDYVDINNNGPDNADLGYWVKFTYSKAHDEYKWRAPFLNSSLNKATNSDFTDDRASFLYGEKEVYYLATAETKTHIAVFEVAERDDALGPKNALQNDGTLEASKKMYKLNAIKLYIKEEYETLGSSAVPLSTTYFSYDYDLCSSVPNSTSGGKLTLTEVWTEYRNSTKGGDYKYAFEYVTDYAASNFDYNRLYQDRWGYYNPLAFTAEESYRTDFPYDKQFDDSSPNSYSTVVENSILLREKIDAYKSAWSLKKITTPTGSEIEIAYEADDYAYVQNKQATQMFKIINTGYDKLRNQEVNAAFDPLANNIKEIYGSGFTNSSEDRRLYFQLEKPIDKSIPEAEKIAELEKYFKGLHEGSVPGSKQLYYKVLVDIRAASEGLGNNGYAEIVEGYADIVNYGLTSEEDNGHYTIGFVELEKTTIEGEVMDYHPIALAAWQYLRIQLPQIESIDGFIKAPAGDQKSLKAAKAKQLLQIFRQISSMFTDYYVKCRDRKYATQIDCDKSVIRLCSPDKTKIGGGIRTKSITITNSSLEGDDAVYGYVYEYDLEDGSSSGVASYEPLVGGDEIALRHAKHYDEEIKLQSDNHLFAEYPMNESYFPAPMVGYSRVLVKSLALDKKQANTLGTLTNSVYKKAYSTLGLTEAKFYTAKDFPVITEYTDLKRKTPPDVSISIPFAGLELAARYTGHQGYKVEVNDMHGRIQEIRNYEVDKDGEPYKTPISYVRYNYFQESVWQNGETANKLINIVPTLVDDAVVENREMGVDYEVFADTRLATSHSQNMGANFNADGFPFFGFVLPSVIPNMGSTLSSLSTIVTNKIVQRSGIVKSIEAYDGQSKVITSTKYFDALSGQPVLVTANNNFDRPVYNYSFPAHWSYEGMGPAYLNYGVTFGDDLNNDVSVSSGEFLLEASSVNSPTSFFEDASKLVDGDLIMITVSAPSGAKYLGYIKSIDNVGKKIVVQLLDESVNTTIGSGNTITLKVVRSGRQNIIGASVGSIQSLTNPVYDRENRFCILDPIAVGVLQTDEVEVFDECADQVFELFNYLIDQGEIDDLANNTINLDNSPYNSFELCDDWQTLSGELTCNNQVNYVPVIDPNGSTITAEIEGTDDVLEASIPTTTYVAETLNVCSLEYVYLGTCTLAVYNAETLEPISFADIDEFIVNPLPWDDVPPTGLSDIVASIDVVEHNASIPTNALIGLSGGCSFSTKTVDVLATQYSECEVVVYEKLNNVLSTSATKYSDSWPVDIATTSIDDNDYLTKVNDYAYKYGSKGIWRPSETFVYREDRVENAGVTEPKPDLDKDGVYNDLTIFQWDNPFFFYPIEDCNHSDKWIKANTFTKYNAYNYQVENENALGIPSAALYGYDGKLAIASASNAGYFEFGFESFETQANTGANYLTNATGNLDFVQDFTGGYCKIVDVFEVDKSVGTTINITDPSGLSSYNVNGYSFVLIGEAPASIDGSIPYETRMAAFVGNGTGGSPIPGGLSLGFQNDASRCWLGKIYVVENGTSGVGSIQNITNTNEEAHTGNKSLKVTVADPVFFPQYLLSLEAGNSFMISAWVKRNEDNYTYASPYEDNGPQILVRLTPEPGTGTQFTTKGKPIGEIINGWQKIEFEIQVPDGFDVILTEIGLQAYGANDVNTTPAYFDDIRVFPADASIETYVYDADDYQLKAVLDDNNFATLYSYDEQGALYLVRKETPKGIMTLETTNNHIKK